MVLLVAKMSLLQVLAKLWMLAKVASAIVGKVARALPYVCGAVTLSRGGWCEHAGVYSIHSVECALYTQDY